MNIEKGLPEKITEDISSAYPKEDKIEMEYMPRKIAVGGEEEKREAIKNRMNRLFVD